MINFGKVKPGTTLYIPFSTFGADGQAITMTGLAVTDIEIYKDGSVTQRSSDAGYTLLDTDGIDLDGVTGLQGFSVSLADNTDAGFYAAGSKYFIHVASITVNAQTVNFVAATFEIEIPNAVLSTTIATLASQTSFTLTAGPAEDDALNGCVMYAHDVASAVQGGYAYVSDYTGSTKTVTLVAGPTFTMAATDNVGFFPPVHVFGWLGTAAATPTVAGVPEVDLTHIGGDAQSGTDLKDFADAGYDPATNKVQGVVLVDTVTTLTGHTAQTGDSFARLGAPAGASVSADIAAIEAQTDDIGAAGAGLTAVPWNAAWDAEVQSEVQDALEANNLDHLVGTATAIPAVPAGTFLDQIMDDGTAAYDRTTDSLQAIRDRGDAAWITATGFSTHSAADVWSVATRVLTAGTNLNNLSAAEVLTQVNAAIDTAIAELGVAAPTATPTLRTGLMLLYMALRNKTTSTATETTISNNAGTTIATAAQSDDGDTYEKSEFA